MSSALSITRAVNPPRAVYLDYPLGHTTGKPNNPHLQKAILRDALAAFEEMTAPGEIKMLGYEWAEDDSWKDRVMRPTQAEEAENHSDSRVQRYATPQYQCEQDEALGEANMASHGCPTCVWLEEVEK